MKAHHNFKGEHGSDRLSRWVHITLLSGVVVSLLVLIAGLIVVFVGEAQRPEVHSVRIVKVLRSAVQGDGVGILETGLRLITLTAVARVALLIYGWGLDGDWRFTGISLAVLVLLATCITLGSG